MRASAAPKRCSSIITVSIALKIKVVRIFNTYGPRMHPNDGRVVSNFILQALRNEDITLYGDGNQTRAFCFVDDLIEGFVRLMATGPDITGPINIGNPHEIPVRELAERIIRLTGASSRIVHRPLPEDDPLQRCPDITMAQNVLGWQPTVELDAGLARTVAYFKQMLGGIKDSDPHAMADSTARPTPADKLFCGGRQNLTAGNLVQMTRRKMPIAHRPQNRLLRSAAVENERAAGMKPATRRRVDRARNITLQNNPLPPR